MATETVTVAVEIPSEQPPSATPNLIPESPDLGVELGILKEKVANLETENQTLKMELEQNKNQSQAALEVSQMAVEIAVETQMENEDQQEEQELDEPGEMETQKIQVIQEENLDGQKEQKTVRGSRLSRALGLSPRR
jgi:hypothetical protein